MDIGVIGCGSISNIILNHLNSYDEFNFLYFYDLDINKSKEMADSINANYCMNYEDFIDDVDLIVESASQKFLKENILEILKKSDILVLSVGALLNKDFFEKIFKTSEKFNHKVYIPSGAVIGLDGLKACVNNDCSYIKLTTIKSPVSLGLNSEEKEILFTGKASDAIELFPKNINVAASISLACRRDIDVEIISDPLIDFNIHILEVKGKFGEFKTVTSNKPCKSNLKTSELAALSAVEKLKSINNNISLGT